MRIFLPVAAIQAELACKKRKHKCIYLAERVNDPNEHYCNDDIACE